MKHLPSFQTTAILLGVLFFITACGGAHQQDYTESGSYQVPQTAHYKVGQPYQINGSWYHPQEDYSYDETGLASWYGQDFHNKLTANGEVFNKNELTAAHKTLQMPSLARVTNLENGRAVVVRINDRGPYVRGRIIDVSRRAAELLGFRAQGVAKVRVQVLADESKAIAEAMQRYGTAPRYQEAHQEAYQEPYQEASVQKASYESPVAQPVESEPLPTIQTVKPVAHYTQLPVTDETNLYVQAGSFSNKDNAYRLKERLRELGSVSVTEALVRGAMFYRVRLGPLSTVQAADATLAQVHDAGVKGARIFVAR
ncbi:MAG: septal ring lytic transglycosylase RlpA family protein [Bdellovibrionales bacterium]